MARPKSKLADLAVFGGRPLFENPRPIAQLDTPPVDAFLAHLRTSLDTRRLTNGGPCVQELERRLADFHAVPHCVAVANAGLGLMMLLQAVTRGRPGEVILPAFTFRGLPHFVRWAGHVPRFADVSPDTHCLSPAAVSAAISGDTRAILGVCNFNSAGDVAGLSAVARAADLPIVFDSVYAAGCRIAGVPVGAAGAAEVFSLHASKLINGFEGGYITTSDSELAEWLRTQRNFGYGHEDVPSLPPIFGLNAKLNEAHAAMALLSLEQIDTTLAGNRARYERYAAALADMPGIRLVPPDAHFGTSTSHTLLIAEVLPSSPLGRDALVELLRAEGAMIGPYYSPALHLALASPPELPVTEDLAGRFLQLPGGTLTGEQDIEDLAELLRWIGDNGDVLARRLP